MNICSYLKISFCMNINASQLPRNQFLALSSL